MALLAAKDAELNYDYNKKMLNLFTRLDTVPAYVVFLTHLGQLLSYKYCEPQPDDMVRTGPVTVGIISCKSTLQNLVALRNCLVHYNPRAFRKAVEALRRVKFNKVVELTEYSDLLSSIDWDGLVRFYLSLED